MSREWKGRREEKIEIKIKNGIKEKKGELGTNIHANATGDKSCDR